jgi:hypothetical protein
MDNQTEVTGLDAVQLAALRKADDLCFVHNYGGQSYIRAIKRKGCYNPDPFAQDVEFIVACGTRWHDYAKGLGIQTMPSCFEAFEMVGNYPDSCWRTIAGCLRKGDELVLEWSKDCQSPVVNDAALHVDYVQLVVVRGDQRLKFHIDHSISPDNSARMIKNVRYPVPANEYSLTD